MAILPVTVLDLQTGNGSAALPAQAFTAEPTTGFSRISAGVLCVSVLGVENTRFSNNAVILGASVNLKVPGNGFGGLAVGGDYYNHVLAAFGYNGNPLNQLHQVAVYAALQGNSNVGGLGADGFVAGFESAVGTQPGSYTVDNVSHYQIASVNKGAGTTIVRTRGFVCGDETAGTHNAAIARWQDAFTGDWFIYYGGTRKSFFGGDIVAPPEIYRSSATSYLRLAGGSTVGGGAVLSLFGETHASLPNLAQLTAAGGITLAGEVTFGNEEVGRSVDNSFVRLYGGVIAAAGSANLLIFGSTHANANQMYLNASGGVFASNLLITAASVSGTAGLRLPHGSAPSAPVDGDVWTTSAGMFIRINGVTKTVTLT